MPLSNPPPKEVSRTLAHAIFILETFFFKHKSNTNSYIHQMYQLSPAGWEVIKTAFPFLFHKPISSESYDKHLFLYDFYNLEFDLKNNNG